jgi:hypothetical protein
MGTAVTLVAAVEIEIFPISDVTLYRLNKRVKFSAEKNGKNLLCCHGYFLLALL